MEMTRKALLALAKQSPDADQAMCSLAESATTVEAVSSLTGERKQLVVSEEGLAKKLARSAHVSLFCSVAILAASCFTGFSIWVLAGSLSTAMLSTILQSAAQTYSSQVELYKAQLHALKPIANSDSCFLAAELVERAYPSVLAWRDFAIAERGELYGFDVQIMNYLHRQEFASATKAEAQQSVEEACRKAHGIPSVTA